MRRTVGLVATVGALAALTGAATGATRSPESPPPVTAPAPVDGSASPAGAVVGAVERVPTGLGDLRPGRELRIHRPGATYLKVHFSKFGLAPGDRVTVSDPGGAEVHRYDAAPPGPRWAMSVTGDTAVVRLDPGGSGLLGAVRDLVGLSRSTVTVDRVARGLAVAAAGSATPPPGAGWRGPAPTGREESVCGGDDTHDAVCYESSHPEVYRRTWPVARLLVNGHQLCTAFRVGPGNLMLTNHHCLASTADARRTEVWFNYRCVRCGGGTAHPPTKVRASEVVATDRELDFTLFRVDDFDAVAGYGHLELDPRPVAAGERVYIPQHPMGLPTRVALGDRDGDCVVVEPQTHGYGWFTDTSYHCDTRGGSSGAPVLSRRTHKVIALHHFGGCPNSGIRAELLARYLPSS